MNLNTQKGWTLVEIAMVFVVISILLGAVLKANEMIVNARLKKIQVAEAGIIASLNLYYDRYRQFPGDDPDATAHFTAYVGRPEVNGDGDGEIGIGDDWELDITTPLTDGEQETLKFFGHLRAAGFIVGTSSDFSRPRHVLDSGEIGIQAGALGLMRHCLIFGRIKGEYVRIIDGWHDDNDTGTGTLRSNLDGDGMNFDDTATSVIVNEDRYHLAWELAGQ